jgi:rfaE bifunctional protein nucleotidyltransferase chain/domain
MLLCVCIYNLWIARHLSHWKKQKCRSLPGKKKGRSWQRAVVKLQGDVLVVLLNSDVSIQGYKGPSRPIIPEQNRATLLTALRAVDLVMLFDDLTPLAILDELRPNVLVNGGDYGLDCIERPIVEAYGGRIYIVERTTASEATSAIIAKIRATE